MIISTTNEICYPDMVHESFTAVLLKLIRLTQSQEGMNRQTGGTKVGENKTTSQDGE